MPAVRARAGVQFEIRRQFLLLQGKSSDKSPEKARAGCPTSEFEGLLGFDLQASSRIASDRQAQTAPDQAGLVWKFIIASHCPYTVYNASAPCIACRKHDRSRPAVLHLLGCVGA